MDFDVVYLWPYSGTPISYCMYRDEWLYWTADCDFLTHGWAEEREHLPGNLGYGHPRNTEVCVCVCSFDTLVKRLQRLWQPSSVSLQVDQCFTYTAGITIGDPICPFIFAVQGWLFVKRRQAVNWTIQCLKGRKKRNKTVGHGNNVS